MSKTLTNVLFATAGVLVAQFLSSLRSFVLARLIDPSDYGIWTGVQMIVTLSPIVCLGTVEALLKQVPYFRGKGDPEGLRKVEETVFATMVLSALLVALVFLVGYPLIPFQFVRQNLLLSQLTAAAAAIAFFRAFYYHRCAAYEDFKSVSAIDTLQSLLGVFFVLFCGWRWGLTGAVTGYFIGELLTWVVAAWICGRAHGRVQARFETSPMLRAVQVGFPITIIWWVYALQTTVGRMTSISFLGNTQTGYYGAASSFAMLFALIPNTIGRVFYPRVNAQVGGNTGLERLRESVVLPTAAIALLLPLTQVMVFYLLPLVYHELLPKYEDGLTCAQILIMGAFFVGLIRNGANYLIAVDRQMQLMKYVLASLIANAAGCLISVWAGFGINGIAVAASAASALLASLIWNRVFAELGYDRKSQLSIFAKFYLSFFATLGAIGVVEFGFPAAAAYSRIVLPIKMAVALAICGAAIMSFEGTRGQMKDLYQRGLALVAYRFRQPAVK